MKENDNKINSDSPHILVVDDEEAVRKVVQQGIKHAGYDCSIASDATEALKAMEEKKFDVIITDIQMPGLSGIELSEVVKQKYDSDVIIMTGFLEEFTYENVIEKGASDFIQKPVGLKELIVRLKRVLTQRSLLTERNRVVKELELSLDKFKRVIDGIVQAMSLTVETRDPYTAGHQRRVADLSHAIAGEMSLLPDQIDGIFMAGLVHDIGKISVPAEILSKPGRLTEIEFALVKAHAQVGYDILKGIEFPWPIAQVVLQHHERWNGSGYPQGLSGEEIVMEARILAVSDVVEAMASHRPYRPALGIDKALEEISKNKDVLYDPEVADACSKLFTEKGFEFPQSQ